MVIDQAAHAVEVMLADHVRVFGIVQDVVSEVLLERFVQLPNKLVSNAFMHEQVVEMCIRDSIGCGANRDLHQRGLLHGRFIVREAIEAHFAVVGVDARLRETAEAHVVVR